MTTAYVNCYNSLSNQERPTMFTIAYGNFIENGIWAEQEIMGRYSKSTFEEAQEVQKEKMLEGYDFCFIEKESELLELALEALKIYMQCVKEEKDPTKPLAKVMSEIYQYSGE